MFHAVPLLAFRIIEHLKIHLPMHINDASRGPREDCPLGAGIILPFRYGDTICEGRSGLGVRMDYNEDLGGGLKDCFCAVHWLHSTCFVVDCMNGNRSDCCFALKFGVSVRSEVGNNGLLNWQVREERRFRDDVARKEHDVSDKIRWVALTKQFNHGPCCDQGKLVRLPGR